MSADFWAGYVSGAVGIAVGNPLDLLKTRLQAGSSDVHATSASSLRSNFDRAGTLLRGMAITTAGTASGTAKFNNQHRRNSTNPHLRRPKRPPLRLLQPHPHPLRSSLNALPPLHRSNEDLPRRRSRRPRHVHRLRTHRTDKVPCAGSAL
jgi:hypothetical protein